MNDSHGRAVQPRHDQRYDLAEEYLQVMYRLWEGSWEDGAALRDRERRMFADSARIHRVRHKGQFYRLDAIHLCEPSPQRTPVLYQAGASAKGMAFAAKHAECVFVGDSPADIGAGKNAGMRTIVAGWHPVYLDEVRAMGPDCWAEAPADVVALLE